MKKDLFKSFNRVCEVIIIKAVIIAAGQGSRLNPLTNGIPKPLVNLLGLSLIERIILTAKRSGINEFIIVIGYKGEKIKKKLGKGEKLGVKIRYIENKEWEKGNGISVWKSKRFFKRNETFILMMSDHIFDPNILIHLQKFSPPKNGCILCVDKEPPEYIDLEDATKVKMTKTFIKDIGKDIKKWNAVDCGIFLCTYGVFKALEESIKKGDDTLSGGIKILAKKEKVRSFEINKYFWIDIDTPNDLKNAEKYLLSTLIKSNDGLVSQYINRKISTKISKLIVNTSISPTLMSVITFIIGCLSAMFFFLGDYINLVIGGILAQISSILDGCDGEIARLKFLDSPKGGWIDSVLDRYVDGLIVFGMSWGFWVRTSVQLVWIFGILALMGCFLISYTADRYEAAFKQKLIPKKLSIPITRDGRLLLIMIGSLLNQIFYTLVLLSILTHIEIMRRLLAS